MLVQSSGGKSPATDPGTEASSRRASVIGWPLVSEQRVVLHLDMDAFYASVEQRERPELRGRPVVVGADPKQGEGRGVVAAASYEARRYGIHSAQPISQAWRNCPGAEFVRPRFELYQRVGRRARALFEDAVDVLEPVSVDEAYADATERTGGSIEAGARLGRAIKRRVRDELDLTCSVGVAENKLAAKIAADEDKPDGLTVVERGEVAAFLAPREVDAIPGVGDKTRALLTQHGVETVADLAAVDPSRAGELLGTWGPRLVARARGRDERPVDPAHERKSVGTERTFPEDRAPDRAREVLTEVAREAVRRLNAEDGQARTLAVKVRLEPFETFTRQRRLEAPTDDAALVEEVALELFDGLDPDRRVRLLGVRLSGLLEGPRRQATLEKWPAGAPEDVLDDPVWERDDYWRFA